MRNLLLCMLIIAANIMFSQTYYGENNFGRLEIINDSICTVTFTMIFSNVSVDTCFYHKNSDTIWISSSIKKRYNIITKNDPISVSTSFAAPVRVYRNADRGNYRLVNEFAVLFDSEREQFIANEQSIYVGDLLVIKDLLGYQRMVCEENSRYFIIKNNAIYSNRIIFDEFPLLIYNNHLISIDKNKNKQCWIDNGFYFPDMEKDKKDRNFNVIKSEMMGLMDVPNEFEMSKNYFPVQITP